MIPVLWVPQRSRGSWDMGIVEELTAGDEFDHAPPVVAPQDMPGAVVVLAGQHCLEPAEVYAEQIARLPWALTIVTSDEEALFPVELLPHDDKHAIWGQYHARPECDRVIPIGAQPRTWQYVGISGLGHQRDNAVFFAGQDTHSRRHELLDAMKEMACDAERYGGIMWAATTGFRQGLTQDRYLDAMLRTRVAPCPSGPHSLDSFRLYEALAAGCLPIIENSTPHGNEEGFWKSLFGASPIPLLDSWDELPACAPLWKNDDLWQSYRNVVQEWWSEWRADLTVEFAATIERLRS